MVIRVPATDTWSRLSLRRPSDLGEPQCQVLYEMFGRYIITLVIHRYVKCRK